MKKRITFTVIFICSLFTVGYAQQKQYYYNKNLDRAGYANAWFQGNKSIDEVSAYIPELAKAMQLNSEFDADMREIEKLSKMDRWLCWQALNEYDFKEGETYVVHCTDPISYYSDEEHFSVLVCLTITDKGNSFKWRAFRIHMSTL